MPNYLAVTTAAEDTLRKILAQRAGVTPARVNVTTHGGRTASVHWDKQRGLVTLNLPSLDASAQLTRAHADRIVGYVAHEACHVLHTDWTAWGRAVNKGARVRTWTNALEDLRIEAVELAAGRYGAMRDLLGRVSEAMLVRALADRQAAGQPRPGAQGMIDAPYVASVLGRLATGYVIPSATGLDKSLSPETRKLVRYALKYAPRCDSTQACLRLATRIVALEATMKQDTQDDVQQPELPEPATDSQPGDTQPQDDVQQDAQPQDAQGDDAQDDNAPTGGPLGTAGAPREEDLTALGEDDLGDVADGVSESNGSKAPTHGAAGLHGWTTVALAKPNDHYTHETSARAAIEQMIPGGKAVLQQEIQRLLAANEQRWLTHHETTGRLDRRALPRMRAGATDVFTRRHERPGENAAVMVLWDLSSSMDNPGRMEGARGLVWELYRATQAAGTEFGCYGFEHNGVDESAPIAQLRPIIALGERPAKPAARIMATRSHGWTGLAPAIPAAAHILLGARDATRRVLLVLTDGDCDYGAKLVRDACKLVTQWGVEVVGLGIDAERTIAASFPDRRSVNVANVEELGKRGLRLVNDLLERAQA
jgi:Mg-chelatase subunit ChlD